MHPSSRQRLLVGLVLCAGACTPPTSKPPKDPCDPNPCTQENKDTCASDNGQALCLCRAGTLPRPNGACETPSTANCPEHAGDGAEPDDCIARAVALADGQSRAQGIEPVGDYDFFRIDATARSVYVLSAASTAGALLPRVDVFDPSGTWVRAQEGTVRVEVGFKARLSAPYTVRVSHSPRDPSPATGQYTLGLAPPVQDDFGDTSAEASLLTPTPNGTVPPVHSGRFEYGQDEDWFAFSVVRDGIYRIEFDTTRPVPTLAAFIRENVKTPFRVDQNAFVEFTAASSTTVFLDLYSATQTPASYAFRVLQTR